MPWIALQQVGNRVAGFVGEPRRVSELHGKDLLPQLLLVWREEWRMASKHLIEQAPQSPLVHGLILRRTLPHLGRPIGRGAASGFQQLLKLHLCTPAKVADLQLTAGRHQHVLELQVAVYPGVAVHPLHTLGNLLEVECRLLLSQATTRCLLHNAPQGPPLAILQEHVEVGAVVERGDEAQDVGMAKPLVDPDLPLRLVHHVPDAELVLLHTLQRKELSILAAAHQTDHGKGTLSQQILAHGLVLRQEVLGQCLRVA
mmetsp:Transcript_102355/g.330090  ORF Transcript_102355/g.330090 Transcript_102355/m.330090 type:complete len:257 (+) Transcript_102355:1773-2543(+)